MGIITLLQFILLLLGFNTKFYLEIHTYLLLSIKKTQENVFSILFTVMPNLGDLHNSISI